MRDLVISKLKQFIADSPGYDEHLRGHQERQGTDYCCSKQHDWFDD